jgi:hypothetical protein
MRSILAFLLSVTLAIAAGDNPLPNPKFSGTGSGSLIFSGTLSTTGSGAINATTSNYATYADGAGDAATLGGRAASAAVGAGTENSIAQRDGNNGLSASVFWGAGTGLTGTAGDFTAGSAIRSGTADNLANSIFAYGAITRYGLPFQGSWANYYTLMRFAQDELEIFLPYNHRLYFACI